MRLICCDFEVRLANLKRIVCELRDDALCKDLFNKNDKLP